MRFKTIAETTAMSARRNRTQAAVAQQDWGWTLARRLYCLFCAAMTSYLVFVATWIILHPVV